MKNGKLIYSLLITLVLTSYGFTWVTYQTAMAADQTVKKEVKEQATEIKKDLSERLTRMEERIQKTLKDLAEAVRNGQRRDSQ